MIAAGFAFVQDEPPVVVDWLPWNHTFGGNHNFDMALVNGGSLYIDDGKPTPPGVAEDRAQSARDRADHLFQRAQGLRGAGAASPRRRGAAQELLQPAQGAVLCRRRLEPDHLGRPRPNSPSRPPASASFSCPRSARPRPRRWRSPAPGIATGRAISGCRCRASNSSSCRTTASWKRACAGRTSRRATGGNRSSRATAFDDEGFYKIGDALKFADPARSGQGLPVRRPHRRGFQARHRHLGQRRAAARALHRCLRAACARRGVRRPRPRRHRGAGVSRRRGLPQARARACRRRDDRPPCSTTCGCGELRRTAAALARQPRLIDARDARHPAGRARRPWTKAR